MTEMTARTLVVVVALVVAATVAALPAAAGPTASDTPTPEAPASGNTTAGEALSSAFAVHGTELGSEVEQRALAARLNRSTTNETRARVLRQQVTEANVRLAALAERRQALVAARERGEIGPREYRVRAARLAAETQAIERVVAGSERAAATLPTDLRRAYRVDAETFAALRNETERLHANVSTGQVRTWNRTGTLYESGPNATENWTNTSENTTMDPALAVRYEAASANLTRLRENASWVESRVDENDSDVQRALECASDHIASAEAALEDARRAAEAGDTEAFEDALGTLEYHAERAGDCLAEALEADRSDGTETESSGDYDWGSGEKNASGGDWTYS